MPQTSNNLGEFLISLYFFHYRRFRLLWLEIYNSEMVERVTQSMENAVEKFFQESSSLAAVVEDVKGKSDFFASIKKARSASNQKTSVKQRAKSLVSTWMTSETGGDGSLDDSTFLGRYS
jgi:hypothetical protein